MKKVIIYLLLFVILFLLSRQIYWIIKEGGNVVVYVTNQSNKDEIEIEVNIDGKKPDLETYTNQLLWYKKIPYYETFGKHTLEVKVREKGMSQTKEFFVFGAKWINVELYNQAINDTYELQISVNSSPVVIE